MPHRDPNKITFYTFKHLIAYKAGFTLKDTGKFLNAFREVLETALIQDRAIYFDNLGVFYIKKRDTSMLNKNMGGGNIKTTADYIYSPRFKLSEKFKRDINVDKRKIDKLEKEGTGG